MKYITLFGDMGHINTGLDYTIFVFQTGYKGGTSSSGVKTEPLSCPGAIGRSKVSNIN